MSEHEKRLIGALSKIAEVASDAVKGATYGGNHHGDSMGECAPSDNEAVCTPKKIPRRLQLRAAATAAQVNPVNAPMVGAFAEASDAVVLEPMRIAILTTKYWGSFRRRLTVSFMESTPADLRARIISHMNAWSTSVSFVETAGTGVIRISRGRGGYWSYLGTDILLIPRNRQTMNLAGFTMNTPESEYRRVVRHETGHTLGFPHEHMRREIVARIDPDKAYAYFLRTQGWDRQTVDQQVLTPLDQRSIFGTTADQTSIMCYQLPGEITRDGLPIRGGEDINALDAAFARLIYPPLGRGLTPEAKGYEADMVQQAAADSGKAGEEWEEWEDVVEPDLAVGT